MKKLLFLAPGLCAVLSSPAHAQSVDLNYDRLSSLEEPIAYDFAGITFELTGVLDTPVLAEFDNVTGGDDPRIDVEFVGNFQVSAETQLSNRWDVGVTYFGQYSTDPARLSLNGATGQNDYSDNVAGFVRTSFGTVIGGNVSNQVDELTRRARGVGNASLAFDGFYGQLDRWGGAYIGRFGPSQIGVVVDENGDFEVGGVFQRPIGQRDLRLSGRVRQGRFASADGITDFSTLGVGAVGEVVFGSSIYDIGAGYERIEGPISDFDRWFVSAGAQSQFGGLRLSGALHYGEAGGQSEVSAAIGAGYDISRGLSLNLGLNAEEARIIADGVELIETDQLSAIASARYSF
ncbi:hypothetical protein [uncultured Erythrobacter sp.]|uniref:hypothetical protein n=1 Tax=uncultured Erythrobacter sp. TaxID=263913 RepID=UPI0026207DB5|nr:hypothetical protein [uncultured Erythrobacter sp.]